MPTLTDVVIFCFLLFFMLDGWRKGFLNSAIGPMIFAFCSLLGVIYFDLTQNSIKAIFYTGSATAVLTLLALIFLAIGKRSVDPSYRDYSPIFSRIIGSIVNVLWQGFILIFILFLLALSPIQVYGFKQVRDNIQNSISFSLIKRSLSELTALQRLVTAFSVLEDPDKMQKLSSTEEFRQFFFDKKVKALFEDKVFMEHVEKKDFSKIISHPQVMELFGDDALVDSFNRLAGKIYSMDLNAATSPEAPPQ